MLQQVEKHQAKKIKQVLTQEFCVCIIWIKLNNFFKMDKTLKMTSYILPLKLCYMFLVVNYIDFCVQLIGGTKALKRSPDCSVVVPVSYMHYSSYSEQLESYSWETNGEIEWQIHRTPRELLFQQKFGTEVKAMTRYGGNQFWVMNIAFLFNIKQSMQKHGLELLLTIVFAIVSE